MAAPADDAPKLFVGQVPRDWDADALRSALEEAGSVHEVIIVRDRGTGLSKGGCSSGSGCETLCYQGSGVRAICARV